MSALGMKWWTNGEIELRSIVSPGENWQKGRSLAMREKVSHNYKGSRAKNTISRFFSLIKREENGCEYLQPLNDKRSNLGSRYFALNGVLWIASRLAYTLRHGTIPDGFNVCHTCDNSSCLRDDHHFLGTQADNVQDMMLKGRHRSSFGDANGSRTKPEKRPRGDKVNAIKGHRGFIHKGYI